MMEAIGFIIIFIVTFICCRVLANENDDYEIDIW